MFLHVHRETLGNMAPQYKVLESTINWAENIFRLSVGHTLKRASN